MIYQVSFVSDPGEATARVVIKRWSEKMHRHRAQTLRGTLTRYWHRKFPHWSREVLKRQLAVVKARQRLGGTAPEEVLLSWEDVRTSSLRIVLERMVAAGLDPAGAFQVNAAWTGHPNVCFRITPPVRWND